jgi:ribosomal protein S12 methylthiotransferase accessory factor YcaO
MDGLTAQTDFGMRYELRLMTTEAATGYFAATPVFSAGFDEMLSYLREHPYDEFMHKHLTEMIATLDEEQAREIYHMAKDRDWVLLSILCEISLLYDKFAGLREYFDTEEASKYSEFTPLIYIKSSRLGDNELHYRWIQLLESNIMEHKILPAPDAVGPPSPVSKEQIAQVLRREQNIVYIRDVRERLLANSPSILQIENATPIPSPGETARNALEKLESLDAFAGDETRHVSSLSPHGFLRKWRLNVWVENGRHSYSLSGIQTSYGRGLTEEVARASYSMEMIERYSSFASFGGGRVMGYLRDYPLRHARYTELEGGETPVLDPDRIGLEAPYENEPLYWLEGELQDGGGLRPVLVPAQCVFLFCNLDEISLFSGLGSTGLASGNTMEQAKVSALLEVIERDCEGVTLYDPKRCFQVESNDPLIQPLLADYRAKGIHVRFQDISSFFGVPCYRCFVATQSGEIIKGTGAHLNSKRALVSAMTETPYGYPSGPPTAAAPKELPTLRLEDLPDYSTNDPVRDLEILEAALTGNGYHPIYVDLTRKDLKLPVVRALVPGLELLSDFDRFSRVSPRLFANYLHLSG